MPNKTILERLYGDEMQEIDEILLSTKSEEAKNAKIREQLISIILRHATIAKEMLQYQAGEEISPYKQAILQCVGGLIAKEFELWNAHGAGYQDLVYFFGAPSDVIAQIEGNGDTEKSFPEIITKYLLGQYNHSEICLAILAHDAEVKKGVQK